jgi:hypothetical protein
MELGLFALDLLLRGLQVGLEEWHDLDDDDYEQQLFKIRLHIFLKSKNIAALYVCPDPYSF